MSHTPVDRDCPVPSITSSERSRGQTPFIRVAADRMVLGLRQGLSERRHQREVFSACPCQSAFNGRRKGLQFDGTNFAWALSCQNAMASQEGARPMLNSNRQSETSSPAATASPDLEAI